MSTHEIRVTMTEDGMRIVRALALSEIECIDRITRPGTPERAKLADLNDLVAAIDDKIGPVDDPQLDDERELSDYEWNRLHYKGETLREWGGMSDVSDSEQR